MSASVVDAHVTLGEVDDIEVSVADVLTQMDRAGVAMALLSPDPRHLAVAHREGHEVLRAACAAHPQRLRWYATANPWLGPAAVAELRWALEQGAAAIKLNPYLQGFQPVNAIVDPLLEVARDYQVPVYVHTGTPVMATPLQVAALARRFPEVSIILGRAGKTDFKADAAPALSQRANLYGDTAHDFPLTGMATQLAAAPGRVVFSSDYPYGDMVHELRRARAVPVENDQLDALLGGTLLGLLRATP